MKRLLVTLVLLVGAGIAHSQPVPVTWRPPVTCATSDYLKWSGSAWVCSGGAAATITGSANVVIKSNGSGSGVASLWTDDGTTTAYNTNKFTIASATGNTAVAGTLGVTGTFDSDASLAKFGTTDGAGYFYEGILNGGYTSNATADLSFNFVGYQAGTTQFRNSVWYDGKNAEACRITGSSKSLNCVGGMTENGTAVLSGAISANVIPKGSGGNLVDSSISDSGTTVATTLNTTVATAGGNGTIGYLTVGQDVDLTTNARNGLKWQAYSNGDNFLDSKTFSGGSTHYRVGAGAEAGTARDWLTVTNSTGATNFAAAGTFATTLAVNGNTTLGSDVYLNATSGTTGIAIAPTGSERVSIANNVGATFSIANNSDLGLYDFTSMAQGVGGAIEFMGAYTGSSSTQAALIKAMKSTGKDNAWDFDLAFGTRRDQSGDVTKRLVIEAGGTTSALGGLVGVKGTAASMFGADVSDIFYSGFIRKNLSMWSHTVGNNAGGDGNWSVANFGSTTAYATTTDSASPYGYDYTDTVGQITCTNGGTACTAGGSYYRYIATSASTGITDTRSKTFTLSVWVKAASGTNANFTLGLERYNDGDTGSTTCTVNATTWTRCSYTRTFSATSFTDNSELRAYLMPLSTTAHEIAGVQIELGSDPTLLEETDGTIGPGAYAYSSASAPAYSVGTAYDYAIGAWAYTLGVGNTAQNPTFQVGFNGDAYGHSLTSLQTSGLDASTSFAGDRFTIVGSISGSSDATAAARANYGGYFTSDATRSAGGNAVTNYGIYTEASGAQTNYAIYADLGNTYLGATSGTVGIGTAPTSDKLTIGGKTTIAMGTTTAHASPTGTALEIAQADGTAALINFRLGDDSGAGLSWSSSGNATDGKIVYYNQTLRGMQFMTASTFRMYIDNAGTIHTGATASTALTGNVPALEVGGQLQATGTDPALSSCGTSPTIVGSDLAGIVTIGSGTATSCTVTFASTYTAEPACVLTPQSTTGASWSFSAKSATAFTVTSSGGSNLAGLKFNYHCFKM